MRVAIEIGTVFILLYCAEIDGICTGENAGPIHGDFGIGGFRITISRNSAENGLGCHMVAVTTATMFIAYGVKSYNMKFSVAMKNPQEGENPMYLFRLTLHLRNLNTSLFPN